MAGDDNAHAVRTRAVALRCPQCGEELSGLNGDLLFGCRKCGMAYEVTETGRLRACPMSAAVLDAGTSQTIVWFPFWSFTASFSIEWPPVPGKRDSLAVLPRIDRVYVTAFNFRMRQYFGDPGLNLTRNQPDIASRTGPGLAGAAVKQKSARIIAENQILSTIDARRDITGADYEIALSDASILCLPFLYENHKLIDLVLDIAYTANAVVDLERILEKSGGRK